MDEKETEEALEKLPKPIGALVKNQVKILEIIGKVADNQKAMKDSNKKSLDAIGEAIAIVLVVAVVLFLIAFFKAELIGLLAGIGSFFSYVASLWPKMSAGEQMIALVTAVVGIPGWLMWWIRRKK